ncbi:MAG: stage II sporulation protein M [Desulfobacterales bacterium]|nr:stage II sporulation protein M [Desulfobacterales bacterium]
MVRDYFPPDVQTADPLPPIGKRIILFYVRQFAFIKRMRRFIWLSGILFLLTTAAAAVVFLLNPELTLRWMSDFETAYVQRHPRPPTQWGMLFSILYNNLRVSFRTCLAGLVPFYLLSIVSLVVNAGILSLVFVASCINHEPTVMLFSTKILPHGIIEIPTMIFVAGFSLYLSSQMTKRVFRKKQTLITLTKNTFGSVRQDDLPDRYEAFTDIIHFFIGIILPLILIAALIETFITPLIYRLFT